MLAGSYMFAGVLALRYNKSIDLFLYIRGCFSKTILNAKNYFLAPNNYDHSPFSAEIFC